MRYTVPWILKKTNQYVHMHTMNGKYTSTNVCARMSSSRQ